MPSALARNHPALVRAYLANLGRSRHRQQRRARHVVNRPRFGSTKAFRFCTVAGSVCAWSLVFMRIKKKIRSFVLNYLRSCSMPSFTLTQSAQRSLHLQKCCLLHPLPYVLWSLQPSHSCIILSLSVCVFRSVVPPVDSIPQIRTGHAAPAGSTPKHRRPFHRSGVEPLHVIVCPVLTPSVPNMASADRARFDVSILGVNIQCTTSISHFPRF